MDKIIIGNQKAERAGGRLKLTAEITDAGRKDTCFYSVPLEYEGFVDTERSDCFLAGFIYPAMRKGEDVFVEGTVSARLLFNLNEYLIPMMSVCDPRLKRVRIEAAKTSDARYGDARAVGTGFSAGIDSFFTIQGHLPGKVPEGFALTHLFFFNVGAHGVPKKEGDMARISEQFRARYEKFKPFPQEAGLPFVPVDSDIHKFHPWGHLETATFATVSAVLFLQKGIRRYYVASSGHTYRQLWKFLGDGGRPDAIERVNMMILPWLSTESVDLIDDGNMFDRSQKTAAVADYPPARKYLNVCYGHDTLDTNCSVCPKCSRTLLTLEILGRLDDFAGVFDIPKYRREVRRRLIAETIANEKKNLFARHQLDLARERGVDLRKEVRALDILRAKMSEGCIHSFIRRNPLLKRLARRFFGSAE